MDNQNFKILLDKYLSETITEEENKQFFQMLESPTYQEEIKLLIAKDLEENIYGEVGSQKNLDSILKKLQEGKNTSGLVVELNPGKQAKIFTLKRIAVAVSIILLVALGGYLLFFNRSKTTEIAKIDRPQDVPAPQTSRAMITLANGQKVYLDSAANGTLAQEGNTSVVKTADGKIIYNSTSNSQNSTQAVYNTLTNPRGSKVIDVTLADGTKVWLNNESSLKYPVAFVGNERIVEITGEAYFEVAHNAGQPFKVVKGNTEVTVLGTHFNVNAYDDEDAVRVTLLEGSVEVKSQNANVKIKPGEQAILTTADSRLTTQNSVNLEQVMAWKDGLFSFDKAGIKTIMQQIARWYDMDVSYEGNMNAKDFAGTVSRKENVSQVLKMLETTGAIHFDLQGKKIIVKP